MILNLSDSFDVLHKSWGEDHHLARPSRDKIFKMLLSCEKELIKPVLIPLGNKDPMFLVGHRQDQTSREGLMVIMGRNRIKPVSMHHMGRSRIRIDNLLLVRQGRNRIHLDRDLIILDSHGRMIFHALHGSSRLAQMAVLSNNRF
jgi:hypothetical protein